MYTAARGTLRRWVGGLGLLAAGSLPSCWLASFLLARFLPARPGCRNAKLVALSFASDN